MKWINQPKDKDLPNLEGFTYIIHNTLTGQWYVGKKTFWFKKKKPPLKCRKRKRVEYVESDWREYTGSSNKLNADIKKLGMHNFTKTILNCYKTKFEVSYAELKEQVDRNALFDDKCYNELIRVRLHKRK